MKPMYIRKSCDNIHISKKKSTKLLIAWFTTSRDLCVILFVNYDKGKQISWNIDFNLVRIFFIFPLKLLTMTILLLCPAMSADDKYANHATLPDLPVLTWQDHLPYWVETQMTGCIIIPEPCRTTRNMFSQGDS